MQFDTENRQNRRCGSGRHEDYQAFEAAIIADYDTRNLWRSVKMELRRGVDRRDKFVLSPAWSYSFAAMKLTTVDSHCICLTSLTASSFRNSVAGERSSI